MYDFLGLNGETNDTCTHYLGTNNPLLSVWQKTKEGNFSSDWVNINDLNVS